MRLTDDRYTQQRRRLEVALRMINHQARSATIRECTGISEDRVRKLHRTYLAQTPDAPQRKRGKSPRQVHCLTHNLQARADAALMAGIFHSIGLVDELRRRPEGKMDTEAAARLCDGFELFSMVRPRIQRNEFTLEHAWFLIRSLARNEVVEAATCERCAGLTLQDRYARKRLFCPLCEMKRLADAKQP